MSLTKPKTLINLRNWLNCSSLSYEPHKNQKCSWLGYNKSNSSGKPIYYNMKEFIIVSILLMLLVSGCSTINKWTGKSKSIQTTQANLNQSTDDSLKAIGKWSYATSVALELTDKTNAVAVAKETNLRVQSLAPTPELKDSKAMQSMVGQLVTNNTKLLDVEDKRIITLQATVSKLNNQLEKQTSEQLKSGQKNAEELSKYQAYFGLGALFMGGKRLLWFIIIGAVLFFILKIASQFSPIAGSIFGVFEGFGGMVIKGVSGAVGKGAHEVAGLVESKYKDTLQKTVDVIQDLKTKASAGNTINLQDVTNELGKQMDQSHKDTITELKA